MIELKEKLEIEIDDLLHTGCIETLLCLGDLEQIDYKASVSYMIGGIMKIIEAYHTQEMKKKDEKIRELDWYKRWFDALNGHATVNQTRENWEALQADLAKKDEEISELSKVIRKQGRELGLLDVDKIKLQARIKELEEENEDLIERPYPSKLTHLESLMDKASKMLPEKECPTEKFKCIDSDGNNCSKAWDCPLYYKNITIDQAQPVVANLLREIEELKSKLNQAYKDNDRHDCTVFSVNMQKMKELEHQLEQVKKEKDEAEKMVKVVTSIFPDGWKDDDTCYMVSGQEHERVKKEKDRYQALHEAELGVCEQHCDVVAELKQELTETKILVESKQSQLSDLKAKMELQEKQYCGLADKYLAIKDSIRAIMNDISIEIESRPKIS